MLVKIQYIYLRDITTRWKSASELTDDLSVSRASWTNNPRCITYVFVHEPITGQQWVYCATDGTSTEIDKKLTMVSMSDRVEISINVVAVREKTVSFLLQFERKRYSHTYDM